MAALTDAQISKFAEMAAAVRRDREAAAGAAQEAHGSEDNNAGSDAGGIGVFPARERLDKSGLSDISEPEITNTPSWQIPKKRKREPTDNTEPKREIPYVFHYDGATRRNMAPKIVYPKDNQILNRLKSKPWVREAKSIRKGNSRFYMSTNPPDLADDDDLRFTRPFSPRVLPPTNVMPLKDRKRFFMYTPTPAMKQAMQNHVSEVHSFFPPTHRIGDCMLHPRPPPCLLDGKAAGTIQYKYTWRDQSGVREVFVNYGIIALLVNSRLTAGQKEGWIEEAWHLSHLCGNWICCNWRHHTVEDGPTNISRNGCFGTTKPCVHKPPCMKEKKQKLILPVHKSKRTPAALPGMTIEDVEKEGKEDSESEATELGTTIVGEAEQASAEGESAEKTSSDGASDEGESGPSGSGGSNTEPRAVEVIDSDDDSETDSGSSNLETSE